MIIVFVKLWPLASFFQAWNALHLIQINIPIGIYSLEWNLSSQNLSESKNYKYPRILDHFEFNYILFNYLFKVLKQFYFFNFIFFTYWLYGMLDLILMMAFFNMRICIHNLFFWGTSNKNLFLIWLFLRWWCYEAPSLKTSFMNCEYPSFIRPSISLPINIIIMIL